MSKCELDVLWVEHTILYAKCPTPPDEWDRVREIQRLIRDVAGPALREQLIRDGYRAYAHVRDTEGYNG